MLLICTTLTINFVNDEKSKNFHFFVTRAKLTLNSNNRRFIIYVNSAKIVKKIDIILIVRLRIIEE